MLWTWNIKLLENSFDLQSAVAIMLSDKVAFFVSAQMWSSYSDVKKKWGKGMKLFYPFHSYWSVLLE